MADAKKCDKCGNFFEYVLDNSPGINGRKVRGVALLDDVSRRLKYVDLCPECTLNLCKWLGVSYDMWGGEENE